MSLDVSLYQAVTITCDKCGHEQAASDGGACLFDANVTHNLGPMANAAGIYYALWRPDEMHDLEAAKRADELWRQGHYADAQAIRDRIRKPIARDLIEPLRNGLAALRADPAKFRALEPENKWGTYDRFVPWVEQYLAACEANPTARVVVSG